MKGAGYPTLCRRVRRSIPLPAISALLESSERSPVIIPSGTHIMVTKLWAKLRAGESFGRIIGPPIPEGLVSGLLFCAAISLLAVMITNGYRFTIGPLSMSAHHLRNPLLLFLALFMLKVWLRGARMGMSIMARLRSPLILFLGAVFIYNLNGTTALSGDTFPARYLPLSLLRELDFDLDEFPFLYEPQVPYFLRRINGYIVSAYPPWAAIFALPIYLLPIFGGLDSRSPLLPELEKLAASLITALSVVILFCALRRLTRVHIAWVIAVVYAFGTSSLSTSSQALFQHGPSQFFLCLTLLWLVRGLAEPRFSAYAGFPLAWAIICRPTNALIALPIGAYMLHKHRAQMIGFLLGILPPCSLYMTYNMWYFGSPLTTGFGGTAVGPASFWKGASYLLSTPLREGLLGILVSPSRGLFIYSPIFVFAFVGMVMVWRKSGHVFLKYLSLSPFLAIFLAAKWVSWWGGHSYGPRLLADITPILCVYLYPPFERSEGNRFLKFTLLGLCGLSFSFHALGAFGSGSWNFTPTNVDYTPERLWSWVDSPLVYYVAEIVTDVRRTFTQLYRIVMDRLTGLNAPQ